MASTAPEAPRYSPAEYLALDRAATVRSEFVDGQIRAMSGGSANHSRLKVDLLRLLANQLADGPCEPFDSDLRVRVDPGRYTYPDLMVACHGSRFEDAEGDTLINPTLIVEVVSPSTEAQDRGETWARYRRIPSLRQYVLVSQDRRLVEVFTRSGDLWTFSDAAGLGAAMPLESIGCTVPLDALYARVQLDAAADGTELP